MAALTSRRGTRRYTSTRVGAALGQRRLRTTRAVRHKQARSEFAQRLRSGRRSGAASANRGAPATAGGSGSALATEAQTSRSSQASASTCHRASLVSLCEAGVRAVPYIAPPSGISSHGCYGTPAGHAGVVGRRIYDPIACVPLGVPLTCAARAHSLGYQWLAAERLPRRRQDAPRHELHQIDVRPEAVRLGREGQEEADLIPSRIALGMDDLASDFVDAFGRSRD